MHTPARPRQQRGVHGGGDGVRRVAAYGGWPSPIGSDALVAGARGISAPRIVGDQLYWLERRPAEAGRPVVMRGGLGGLAAGGAHAGLDAPTEVSPATVHVRTRVHEYGGGEYTVWRDWLFFVDDADRRVHGGRIGASPRPLTPAGAAYADLVVSGDGRWLVAVEERPRAGREPENRLVAVELALSEATGLADAGPLRAVAAGHDFYSSPTFDPAARRLVFLAWDHPRMPWQGTWLEEVAWGRDGPAGPVRRRGGGTSESLFQPGFAPDGTLFVVSDRSGDWNLMQVGEAGLRPAHRLAGELGRPQWVFGLSTWAFIGPGHVLASVTRAGRDRLCEIALGTGACREGPAELVSVGGVVAGSGFAACVAGSPRHAPALFAWSLADGVPRRVRDAGLPEAIESAPSLAEAIAIRLPDGRTTHAFVHAPHSEQFEGPPGERPPLLLKSHGGPTSATSAALDPRIQFWTSRGFAVADVNYTGSSGYGRAYRDALARGWGVLDVEDCVAVAEALAAEGRVDRERLAITGGSAGGFTTLCALTFHDVFRAGASHYGIGDLEALVRDTHKFESHYTDWLVGVWPQERARYVERSPIHHVDRLRRPVIFFQGLEDRVVPPNQAQAMADALARRGIPHAYVPFEGEGHGFRRAENIRTALDGELYFYSRLFGFDAVRPAAVWITALLLCVLGCVPLRGGWDSEALARSTPSLAAIEDHRLGDLVPFPALAPDADAGAPAQIELVACRFAPGAALRVAATGPGWPEPLAARAFEALAPPLAGLGLTLAPDAGREPDAPPAQIAIATFTGLEAEAPAGLGDTLVKCDVSRAGPAGAVRGEIERAEIRMRRSGYDEAGRLRPADDAAWVGALLHELGHALGFSGHVAAGDSLLVRDQGLLRALGRRVLRGEALADPTLAALYALPPGRSLGRRPLAPLGREWLEAVQALDRQYQAAGNPRVGEIASAGDGEARLAFRYADGQRLVLRFPGWAGAIRRGGPLLAVPDRASIEALRALNR